MTYAPTEFLYMPAGSYAILPNGEVFFRQEVSAELKERFLKDLEEKKKRDAVFDPNRFE